MPNRIEICGKICGYYSKNQSYLYAETENYMRGDHMT